MIVGDEGHPCAVAPHIAPYKPERDALFVCPTVLYTIYNASADPQSGLTLA